MAVRNMLLPGRSKARPMHPPWATFTDPEVAHVGYTEEQARDRFGGKVRVSTLPMGSVDRAVTDGATEGFIKVVYRDNGTVLGATVVGRNAAEALQGWAIALEQGLKMGDGRQSDAGVPIARYREPAGGRGTHIWTVPDAGDNGARATVVGGLAETLSRLRYTQ